MSINVYWTAVTDSWMRQNPPKPLYNDVLNSELYSSNSDLKSCPAIINYFKNVYKLECIYDYKILFDSGYLKSDRYSQEFHDKSVMLRNYETKFFSFYASTIFFTDADSLLLSTEHPFFEDSEISKKAIVIPGIYDIGKWFRALELPIKLRSEHNSLEFKIDDCLMYLRFHTNEKINFIEFKNTKLLDSYVSDIMASRLFKTKSKPLTYYYDLFKRKQLKKKILKEIQQNIL